MNNGWSNQTKPGQSNAKIQSFLEALRSSQGRGDGSSKEATVNNPFTEFQNRKEIEKRRIEEFHNTRTTEWNRVFSSKEKETAKRIEQIKQELGQLSKQLKNLDANVTKAISAPVTEVGEYQVSFLTHLKETIHLWTLRASEANSWIEMYNRKSKKSGYYWSQAKSKGTSYTQNNERSVATSIG